MHGSVPVGMLLIDQLEAFHGRNANGQSWEAQGWYGNDENKLWVRTEGERSRGKLEDGDIEAFWNHNASRRSEEHTSELQSLMRISYAVFCLKKKKEQHNEHSDRQM